MGGNHHPPDFCIAEKVVLGHVAQDLKELGYSNEFKESAQGYALLDGKVSP
jgi:hypothetical protein